MFQANRAPRCLPRFAGKATALPRGPRQGRPGRCSHRPGGVRGGVVVREGHAPPLHAVRERPAKRDCRGRPGERRAGCPHPAGPRGGANVPILNPPRCGGRERPPYGPGETRRPPGKMQSPRPLQTHVGDDARIVPGCSRRRGVREGHAPPLHAVRERPAKRDCRGRPGERRAGCPHPAGPRGGANVPILNRQGAAGVNARPTDPGKHGGQPGKFKPPRPLQTHVGDDARIVPGCLRRRGVPRAG